MKGSDKKSLTEFLDSFSASIKLLSFHDLKNVVEYFCEALVSTGQSDEIIIFEPEFAKL